MTGLMASRFKDSIGSEEDLFLIFDRLGVKDYKASRGDAPVEEDKYDTKVLILGIESLFKRVACQGCCLALVLTLPVLIKRANTPYLHPSPFVCGSSVLTSFYLDTLLGHSIARKYASGFIHQIGVIYLSASLGLNCFLQLLF